MMIHSPPGSLLRSSVRRARGPGVTALFWAGCRPKYESESRAWAPAVWVCQERGGGESLPGMQATPRPGSAPQGSPPLPHPLSGPALRSPPLPALHPRAPLSPALHPPGPPFPGRALRHPLQPGLSLDRPHLRLARGAGPPRMTKQRPEARDPPPALGGCVACPGAAVMETGRARGR